MIISKNIIFLSLSFASLFPLSTHAMLSDKPKKDFSKLAFSQSAALCCFGTLTNFLGKDLYNSIGYKEVSSHRKTMSSTLIASGRTSIGLGLLSAVYVLISKYKIRIKQR